MSISAEAEAREQEIIEVGRSMKQILAEPAFIAAVKAAEKGYLDEFVDADTDEKRRQVWARIRALQDLLIELDTGVGRGKIADAQRTTREAADDRNRRVTPRKS